MSAKRYLPFLFLTISLLASCKKKETVQEEPTIDFGPPPGVQYRTGQNVPNGGDPTDWTPDGAWNDREKQFFSNLNLSLDAPQQSGTWYPSVYPNPSAANSTNSGGGPAGFTFLVTSGPSRPAPAGAHIAYIIVNSRYQELKRGDVAFTNSTSVPFAANSLAAGALYRLYLVCYVPGQQVYYRTHGDIQVE